MPELAAASALTRHRSFMLFWCARTFTNGAYMMVISTDRRNTF
jgi:hypothetical protein